MNPKVQNLISTLNNNLSYSATVGRNTGDIDMSGAGVFGWAILLSIPVVVFAAYAAIELFLQKVYKGKITDKLIRLKNRLEKGGKKKKVKNIDDLIKYQSQTKGLGDIIGNLAIHYIWLFQYITHATRIDKAIEDSKKLADDLGMKGMIQAEVWDAVYDEASEFVMRHKQIQASYARGGAYF